MVWHGLGICANHKRRIMVDPNPQQGSGRTSRKSRKENPDRAVLGGEVGLWSSDLNALPVPEAQEAVAEIEELGYAALWFGEAWAERPSPTPRCSFVPRAVWLWPPASPTSSS